MLALVIQLNAMAHGAMTFPGPPRSAVDADTLPWSAGIPKSCGEPGRPVAPSGGCFEPWCPFPARGKALSAANAQACFWFTNGASPVRCWLLHAAPPAPPLG